MKTIHHKTFQLSALSALLLVFCVNCGGGALIAGGGIDGTGIISSGIISAFGSIFVNGSEFETTQAVIIVDGEEKGIGDDVVLDNLDIGRLVLVKGFPGENHERFFADQVIYSNNIRGPVQSIYRIDAKTKEIIVLGQKVILNVNTAFKKTSFNTIAIDDVIEVSGLYDETETIWATFIGKTGVLSPALEVEITGYIANLDSDLMTFEVHNLIVDYRLSDTSSLPDGILTAGMLVEVDGILDETGKVLHASVIRLNLGLGTENADQFEITGFVTEVVSTSEFMVGSQAVTIDPQALFVDGTRADIIPGVKLEAEGSLIDGILSTWEIEFWQPDQVEVENTVNEILSATEFLIGDQVVQINENTVFEGGSPDNIEIGVPIEIKGVPVDIDFSTIIADKVSFFEKE